MPFAQRRRAIMVLSAVRVNKEFTVLLDQPLPLAGHHATLRYRFDLTTLEQIRATIGITDTPQACAFDLSENGIGLNLPYALDFNTRVIVRLRSRQIPDLVVIPARV